MSEIAIGIFGIVSNGLHHTRTGILNVSNELLSVNDVNEKKMNCQRINSDYYFINKLTLQRMSDFAVSCSVFDKIQTTGMGTVTQLNALSSLSADPSFQTIMHIDLTTDMHMIQAFVGDRKQGITLAAKQSHSWFASHLRLGEEKASVLTSVSVNMDWILPSQLWRVIADKCDAMSWWRLISVLPPRAKSQIIEMPVSSTGDDEADSSLFQ